MAQPTPAPAPDPKDQTKSEAERRKEELGQLALSIGGDVHVKRLTTDCEQLTLDIEKKMREKPAVDIHTEYFWCIIIGYVFLVMIVLTFSVLSAIFGAEFEIGAGVTLRHIGCVGILLTLVHLGFSFESVRLDEWAGLSFFGKPVWKFGDPGPILVPLGILRLVTEPRVTYTEELPDIAERIVRRTINEDSDSPVPNTEKYGPGEVRPVFVTTGSATLEEQSALRDLLKQGLAPGDAVLFRQMTVDVRWNELDRVEDLFVFDRSIPGDVAAERRVQLQKRLRQIGEAEIREIFSKLTYATIILCWGLIGQRLTLKLRLIALDWGVYIEGAKLLEVNISHKTNEAQANAVRAEFKKIQTFHDADGERYTTEQKGFAQAAVTQAQGQAEADATNALLYAQADGYDQIAKKLGMNNNKGDVLRYELAAKTVEKANYSLYGPTGTMDFLASISGAKAAPPAGTSPPKNTPPGTEKPD